MATVQQAEAAYRSGERFRLHAFVCSQTCVKRTDRDPPPTATFTQIFQQRPADCRYAVIGVWDPPLGGERFIVLDLFDVHKEASTGDVILPKPRLSHDDLDAAIMATVLLYNK